MIKLLIIWCLLGVVVSVIFFKVFDIMHKRNPKSSFSIQGIIERSANQHSETPEGEALLKRIISSAFGIGSVIVWPFLFVLLIGQLIKR
jgi:hypothetical protein